jgi:hypothetical protein
MGAQVRLTSLGSPFDLLVNWPKQDEGSRDSTNSFESSD